MEQSDLSNSYQLLKKYWSLVTQFSHGELSGLFKSQIKGSGLEWQELRPLSTNDDARLIDWKSTAKSGRPHVRLFDEERDLRLLLVVDLSPEMLADCGKTGSPKAELALQVALLLGLMAINNGDQVGWLVSRALKTNFYPFSRSLPKLWQVFQQLSGSLKDLAELEPVPVDFKELLTTCAARCHREATIIFLSDFLAMASHIDSIGALFTALMANKNILALKINDPIEKDLPVAGLLWLTEPVTGQTKLIDTSWGEYRQEWQKLFHDFEVQIKHLFYHHGVRYQQIWVDQDPLPGIATLLAGHHE